jgi:hypothetical protein
LPLAVPPSARPRARWHMPQQRARRVAFAHERRRPRLTPERISARGYEKTTAASGAAVGLRAISARTPSAIRPSAAAHAGVRRCR